MDRFAFCSFEVAPNNLQCRDNGRGFITHRSNGDPLGLVNFVVHIKFAGNNEATRSELSQEKMPCN